MNGVRTISYHLLVVLSYWSFPRLWIVRTVFTTDSSKTFCVSRANNSSLSWRNGFPSSLMTWARLTACSLKCLCADNPSAWWQPWSVPYSSSNFFSSLACSGPESIHFRKAEGFSVSPTAPTEHLTASLFCSWAWSIGIGWQFCGWPNAHVPQIPCLVHFDLWLWSSLFSFVVMVITNN